MTQGYFGPRVYTESRLFQKAAQGSTPQPYAGTEKVGCGKTQTDGKNTHQAGSTLRCGIQRVLAGSLPDIAGLLAIFRQGVIGECFQCTGCQVKAECLQRHGGANPEKPAAGGHGDARGGIYQTRSNQGALAAQNVGKHAAGHFEQHAHYMEHALCNTHCGQRKAAPHE